MFDTIPAYCEVVIETSRNAKPCVVVTKTEDNLFSIGFAFPDDNDQLILAGESSNDQLKVHLVALSGEAPESAVGTCKVSYRVLTCSMVIQGVSVHLKAIPQ